MTQWFTCKLFTCKLFAALHNAALHNAALRHGGGEAPAAPVTGHEGFAQTFFLI
jgi:hypothetical protein